MTSIEEKRKRVLDLMERAELLPDEILDDTDLPPDTTATSDSIAVKKKSPKNLDHIAIGDDLIAAWDGTYRFFRDSWHMYKDGLWQPRNNNQVRGQIWSKVKPHNKSGTRARNADVTSILAYLEADLFVPDDCIDNGEGVIPLKNGLLSLDTYKLLPHDPNRFLTSQLPFDYDPDATCPMWLVFLAEQLIASDGYADLELADLLQEAIGYSLTTDTRHQVSFWLWGAAASGKSTVIEVIQKLSGVACVHLDLSGLDKNHYQLALAAGKRVITCTENAVGSYLADNVFKALVSGEIMQVRQIRKEPFMMRPQAKIWWAMNEPPNIRDRSGAVYRRMKVIPFNRPVPEAEQDKELLDRLTTELSGIFNWALAGLERLRQNGRFTESQQVKDAVEQIRAENDHEAAFIDDRCEQGNGYKVLSSQLYGAYQAWCMENGVGAKSSTKLAREWKRLGFTSQRETAGVMWHGVRLVDGNRKPENEDF